MADPKTSDTPKPAAAPAVSEKPVETPKPAVVPAAAPKPEVRGSTDKLFPEAKPEQPAKTPVTPPTDETVSLEALKGRKIKVGEEVLPVEDLMRRVQSVSQLTHRASELSAMEHQLNEREKSIRKQMELVAPTLPPPSAPQIPENGYENLLKDSILSDDPVFKKVLEDLSNIKFENQELKRLTSKSKYEESLKVLAQKAKEKGHDDFTEYIPKIEEQFRKLPSDQRAAADNFDWWMGTFYDMKLQKSAEEIKALKEKSAPPKRQEGAPIEGIGSPDGGSVAKPLDQQWQSSYDAAFERAKKSGSTDDWAEVFRLKSEAPL